MEASKTNFYYMIFTNRKFSSSESKITDGQIALTKTMTICCNSINMTIEFKTHDTKKHIKHRKSKKLDLQNNK